MKAALTHRTVRTSHGRIFVESSGGEGPTVLLIHGNSSSRKVFSRLMQGPLGQAYNLVALDLPGHGRSGDALDPVRTYSLPGLADSVIELLETMGLWEVAVLGWSLGGHVAIQMLAHFGGIKGLVLVGSPPIRRGAMEEGFVSLPARGSAGRRFLDEPEIGAFARKMFGEAAPAFLRDAIRRSDGRFRERLFAAARAGAGVDQRQTVEGSAVPVAVINGRDDPMIRLDYFDQVAFPNLWSGECHRLAGAGHAPFWQATGPFDDLVGQFLATLEGWNGTAAAPVAGRRQEAGL